MSVEWRVARVVRQVIDGNNPWPWVWLVNRRDPGIQARMSVKAWERQK